MVLLLNHGFMHAWFQRHPEAEAPLPSGGPHEFGLPSSFVPQKVRALKRLKALAGRVALLIGCGLAVTLYHWLR